MSVPSKVVTRVIFLMLQMAAFCPVFAGGNGPDVTSPLLGRDGNVAATKVSDANFTSYNPSPPAAQVEQTFVVKNMVSVGIDEESPYFIQSDFTVTVVLHIEKYSISNTLIEQLDKTFVIDYKKSNGSTYNALQYFPFENAYRVKVTVTSVTPSAGAGWGVSKVLRIDNTITAVRDFVFNCSAVIQDLTSTFDAVNQELFTSWTDPKNGETEFDLEWAWIDESALTELGSLSGDALQKRIFENNATRVTIDTIAYRIPLLYDGAGRLYVRVRPAQIKHNGQRVEGSWSWQNGSSPVYYVYAGHANNLNWQASTSYAEDGKRKSVVQYFDGTLRNRQTVTKDNTTHTTVVAETFYDYQGRAVVQVLPAPTLSNIIQYTQYFNKSITYATNDGYPKWVYDKLEDGADACNNPARAMSTVSGTAKYYSPANEKVNDPATGYNVNKYIPNSEGPVSGEAYPFTETRFAADGRLSEQGGVGYDHQLKQNGHQTKYLYESPAQEELDALFGTDAGVASHYFKNLVKDANGQYSVSYTDMHGRTVATALAGKSPDQLDTLLSSNKKWFTRQLLDNETNRVLGKSIVSTKNLVVPTEDVYRFQYELNPEQLSLLTCSGTPICYDCLYNLKITITSDCKQDSFPFIVVDSNFTIGQILTNPVCNTGNIGKTTGFFNKVFDKLMPEGSYTVTKTLSLSDSAQKIYRDVFIKNDTCRKFQDFYDQELNMLTSKSICVVNCDSCKASIGNTFEEFRQKFRDQSGMVEPLDASTVIQLQAAYKDALANCTSLCNNQNNVDDGMEPIRNIRSIMLADVSPPYGQYAKLDALGSPFNILSSGKDVSGVLRDRLYKHPQTYTPGSGVSDGTYKDRYGVDDKSVYTNEESFSQSFQTSWAESLLPYHPEFPKLRTMLEKLPTAYQFEATLNKTTTWSAAATAGYINNILSLDPFFNGTIAGTSGYLGTMTTKLATYVNASNSVSGCTGTITANLWQMAQAAVFCRDIPFNSPCGSNQSGCLTGRSSTPSLTPTTGCAADWNQVWQIYRSLYLTERKKLVTAYIKAQSAPNNDAVINDAANGLQLRFADFEHPASFGSYGDNKDSKIQDLFTQLNAGNGAALGTAHDLAEAQFDSTCRGYTDMWLAQLSLCPNIATRWSVAATKSADSIWLTDRLVRICKYGSDTTHYLGSSSIDNSRLSAYINAGGSGTLKEFPDVIKLYYSSFLSGPFPTELCHPYMINSPKPFNVQTAVTNELVLTQPTDCECTRLATLKKEFDQYGQIYGNFSTYLSKRYGTNIPQGTLDTLTALCTGSYTCKILPAPIVLPPLFTCNGKSPAVPKPCIDCKDFQALRLGFQTEFSKTAPIKVPQTQSDIEVNKAFQDYANYKTGFSKDISEYISFLDSCGTYALGNCDSLQTILNNFIQGYRPGRVTHVLTPHPGYTGYAPEYTDLNKTVSGGTIQFPDSARGSSIANYNYYTLKLSNPAETFCTSSGYSTEVRIKFISSGKGGDVAYTTFGKAGFTLHRNHEDYDKIYRSGLFTEVGTTVHILDPNTSNSVIENWMTFRLKVTPTSYSLYYNDVFVGSHDTTWSLGNLTNFTVAFWDLQGTVDRVRLWDSQDHLKYAEDFNDPTNPAFVDPSFICPAPSDCQTAFRNYFNSQRGTSYTYNQIEAQYLTNCGQTLKVCSVDTAIAAPSGPLLCGLNEPMFKPVAYDNSPCKELPQIAYNLAREKWQLYMDSLRNVFDTAYYNKCMRAKDLESFKVTYKTSEYHYTLYYYDQAGNLVQTVPPAGVDDKHGNDPFLQNVKAARLRVKNGEAEDGTNNTQVPSHTLVTKYRYNTLNQVVAQQTPDAGKSRFWYDRLGRLAISQNAKQANASYPGGKRYSYTLYDELGRIIEVGQKPQSADPSNSRDTTLLKTWLTANGYNKEQVTRTRYDLSYEDGSDILSGSPSILVQRNLRNRVSYSMVFDVESDPAVPQVSHTAATFYSYDIHGNVDTLLQDLRIAMQSAPGNRYKKIAYNYDLISGKVNLVSYQPGLQDEFYHRYEYDAENRITEVYTSHNNLIWEKDARYSYYRHGPLARTILGQQQVQGVDYAYTLQGWLKGVNSTSVPKASSVIGNGEDCGMNSAVENLVVPKRHPSLPVKYVAHGGILFTPGFENALGDVFDAYTDNTLTSCTTDGIAGEDYAYSAPGGNTDIGQDGVPAANGTANQVANDAYGFSLNYFTGDYKAINSGVTPFASPVTPFSKLNPGASLYNGNISSMAVNIPKVGGPQFYGYRYDQLNRIVAMNVFTVQDPTQTQWTLTSTTNYNERISYDPSGNIMTYKRNGDAARPAMDDMVYSYKPGTNKLDKVVDNAADVALDHYDKYNDIKQGQANGNYQYDEIGNLISDASLDANITNITWNVYGKILSVAKASGTSYYTYDAAGNRITKTANGKTTIYVRDASGNVMSVYSTSAAVNAGNLIQDEVHLYGSTRLGIYNINRNVQSLGVSNYIDNISSFTIGQKFFELSNHLGNVLVTVSDKKLQHTTNSTTVDYYNADVVTANDYYPFGSQMPGRKYTQANSSYRYGFNGKENDNEVKGEGNQQDYGMRIYDPRLGKFLSVDPLTKSYPMLTPYSFAENDVIRSIDLDGLEKYIVTRLVDNRGVFRSITIQTFTDENGNLRDNETYKRNPKLQKADVYTITRNVNTGNQIGAIAYSSALSSDQQIVYNNLNVKKEVKTMVAEDKKRNPNSDGQQINDQDQNEGTMVGTKWQDGKYGEATLNAVVPVPIQFPGGSSTPTNAAAAINQLAPVGRVLNLFPASTATVVGNTGNSPGDNSPTGNSPAVLNQPARLDGNNNSSVGATMRARANTVRRLLNTNFGVSPNRTTPATGVHSPTPAGRNVTIRINGINL